MKEVFCLKKRSNLQMLLSYAGNRKPLTYISWVLSAASALISLLPFWYIWKILDEVIRAAPDFDKAKNITHYGWLAVLFAVLTIFVYICGLMCSHLSAFRIATNIRIALTKHITTLPLGKIEEFGSGKLRRTISETSGAAEGYLAHQLPDKAKAIASIIGLLAMDFIFDWRLGLLSLVPVVIGFIIMMSSMAGSSLQKSMTEYQNALAEMSNEAVEYVRGIPVVKTFGQSVFSFKKFKSTIDNYEKWTTDYTLNMRIPMTLYTLAINSIFAFLIIGAFWFSHGNITGAFLLDMLFYIIITPVITLVLTKIMYMNENEMMVKDAIDRIDSVLNMESLTDPAKPSRPSGNSVELRGVTFSYDGTKNALSDISFKIPACQTTAFVGPSGGGKSTLASIVARFFDPQQGKVLVGGVDVKDIGKEELMNTVSFVFQNSKLIKASILDNVRLGKPNATEAEVMQALKAAQCMDIIEKFPNGVNTMIGSEGVYLSGGEAQRIAIARAVLKNSPIIILDEATAFADPDNEAMVQAAFNELARGKTVIMIAHRLSTVVNADRIFVLREGKLAENGTFDELVKNGGTFANMWNEYRRSIEWKVEKEAEVL